MSKVGSILATLAVATTGLALTGGVTSAAAPALKPASASVAVGATLNAAPTGCDRREPSSSGPTYSYRHAELVLITGTGASERLAAVGNQDEGTAYHLSVPGWVDPAQPAVLAGRCVSVTYDERTDEETTSVAFTYPDVAIDVTPGPASAPRPVASLARSTAEGGQVLNVSITGCRRGSYAQAVLFQGADLSGRSPWAFAASSDGEEDARVGTGPVVVQLALNDQRDGVGISGDPAMAMPMGGPLAEGDYTLLALCSSFDGNASSTSIAEPQPVHVVGTNVSGAFRFVPGAGDHYLASGEGCAAGRTVTVTLRLFKEPDPFAGGMRRRNRALARGSLRALPSRASTQPGETRRTETTVAGGDGSWSISVAVPKVSFYGRITADCGDPSADGFRYVGRSVYEDHSVDAYIERVSPTSSPTGGPVTVHAMVQCDGAVSFALFNRDGSVVASGAAQAVPAGGRVTSTFPAPSQAGTYYLAGRCGGERGHPQSYEVFTPTTTSGTAPLPADPTAGWPSSGERSTYHGRIGPISLPAMDMETGDGHLTRAGRGSDRARAMGPSGLFITVPRPEGDFAITKMTFDVVDAKGMPVGHENAHLHHFVIANTSKTNPACPGSTFGLPGQIVGASGAERTALTLPDPYGLVVKGSDKWTGVYDLMSRTDHDQQVFLTYDMDIRRDVGNVRPITTYFGSATGCGSFTWDIDGSGTPDVQSTYVTMKKDGVLIGTGGHIHNGGLYTDLTDDRGRRLCRSVLRVGQSGHGGHGMQDGMDGGMGTMDPVTTSPATTVPSTMTSMVGAGSQVGYDVPPEMYPDDPPIVGINPCGLHETVKAGGRLRFDAVYENERARGAVMGIFESFVWEGGGPAVPVRRTDPIPPLGPLPAPASPASPVSPGVPVAPGGADRTVAPGAEPIRGRSSYTG